MSQSIRLDFEQDLYDEAAVRETADAFRGGAKVLCRKNAAGLSVTLTLDDDEDADAVAGELANIALARTQGARCV